METRSYSLLELNTYIKRVLALNFESELWVRAEILSAAVKRGHYYLTLIQKDEHSHDIVAQINAVVWATDLAKIKKKNPDLDHYFVAGFEIQCFALPVFHERFGLQLRITGIDSSFTRGALDIRKEALFSRIREEGLHLMNKSIKPPDIYQRIAVISSANAAGYVDFLEHIEKNGHGLKFSLTLYDSVMQGNALEQSIRDAFEQISKSATKFDAVVVIRGGGSKVDLAGFDNYDLSCLIAHFPLPVLTGIGHEIDFSTLDLVANQSFKTPTAVAEYMINQNMAFLSQVSQVFNSILSAGHRIVSDKRKEAEQVVLLIRSVVSGKIDRVRYEKELIHKSIYSRSLQFISELRHNVDLIEQRISDINPLEILRKGYALVYQDGKKIRKSSELKKEGHTRIHFSDGPVIATFKSLEHE